MDGVKKEYPPRQIFIIFKLTKCTLNVMIQLGNYGDQFEKDSKVYNEDSPPKNPSHVYWPML